MPVWTTFMLSAGIASATSRPPAMAMDRIGLFITRPTIELQNRDSRTRPLLRRVNGIRPFSTRSPSHASTAGSTASVTNMAIATTETVATANDSNPASPVMNIPAIAMITVSPEIITARPDVAAATSSASWVLRPAARSSRSRRM